MRAPRLIACLTLLIAMFTASSYALEIAQLRNGFTIPHRSRELRGSTVRLYMDEAKKSFVDLPAEQIQSYSTQPDPDPPAQASNTTAQAAQAQTSSAPSAAKAETVAPPTPEIAVKSTDQIVREASAVQGVDSDFIHSVIQQESGGNSKAVSRAGARGLMQLMPGTAAKLGVTDSFSPEQNVHGGARYLRELLERYHGDAIKALAAYNAGPEAVDRYRGVPPYRETQLYVQHVVRQYNRKKQNSATSKTASKRKAAASANL
jgi:soluble lytic murein transglycosylase-like protein